MKTLLTVVLLLALAAPAGSAEDGVYYCEFWNRLGSDDRHIMIFGYLMAVNAADAVTSDDIASKLWPIGHRVASVVVELEIECRKDPKQKIAQAIQIVARRLNGLPPLTVR